MLQHPVPDDHLKNIGDIVVSFALLESMLQTLIGGMLNEHQRIGQIVTAELSFRNLKALMISLYLERYGEDDEDLPRLKELIKRSGECEERRNQIIHSVWLAGKNPDSIVRVKTTAKEKKGIKHQFQDVSSGYLSALAVEIRELASDILKYDTYLIDKGKAINNPLRRQ